MLYPYMTLADETEILHTDIIKKDGGQHIEVHFERPKYMGFDTARCVLPAYEWIVKTGYTDNEIRDFEEFLKDNSNRIFRIAEIGELMPHENGTSMPNAETLQAIRDAEAGIGLSRAFNSVDELMSDLLNED